MNQLNVVLVVLILTAFADVWAQDSTNIVSPRAQFQKLVAEWQQPETNLTVLEKAEWEWSVTNDIFVGSEETKIITLAATLDPKPEIPEEARRHFIRAEVLMQDAKSQADYDQVIAEYGEVRRFAPWLPNLWYNRAIVREQQGQYANAINCLKTFLLTDPPEADKRKAQDKIYALEAKQEKAGKDKVREEAKARIEQIA